MPVNTSHRTVATYVPQWERCRDAFAGSDAIKGKTTKYLPMLEGHTSALSVQTPNGQYSPYAGYVLRALFYPAVARTVSGLTGIIFGKAPTVTGVPPLYQPEFDDVTLTGDALGSFALRLCNEDLIVGRAGILVDFPEEFVAGQSRPYWQLYFAEQIVNWRTTRINGEQKATLVVLKEEAESDGTDLFQPVVTTQYRVLQLIAGVYTVTIYREDEKNKGKFIATTPRTPQRRGVPLTEIPFVPLGPTGLSFEVEHPPLLDLVDVDLSHYRTSADQEHGAHFTALPTPYIAGHKVEKGETLAIGSGTAWVLPTPGATAGMVEFSGAGLKSLAELKEEKRQLMASLGARMLESVKKAAEAAETVKLKHAGERSALGVLADAVGQALTRALRFHLFWSGATEQVAAKALVTMNPDLMDTLSGEDFKTLVMAWQAGSISHKTLYYNLQWGEWTRPDVEFDEEVDDIESEDPGSIPDVTLPPAVVPPVVPPVVVPPVEPPA